MNTKDEKKTKNEKPVLLLPLPFDETLAAMLRVRPQPKEEKQPKKKSATKQKMTGL